MKPTFSVLVLAATVVMYGCASSTAPAYPRAEVDDVVIYESEDDVPSEFEVIGIIEPRQSSYMSYSAEQQIDYAKQQAAAQGANGLLLLTTDQAVADARIRQAASQGQSSRRTTMVAIRLLGAPPPAQ